MKQVEEAGKPAQNSAAIDSGRLTKPPPSVMTVGEMLRMGFGDRSRRCDTLP